MKSGGHHARHFGSLASSAFVGVHFREHKDASDWPKVVSGTRA
jgi:hypothetical protein